MAKNTYIREKAKNACRHMCGDYRMPVLSFANHMTDIKFSESTVIGRCNALRVFTSFLAAEGDIRIQDVDSMMIERYWRELVKRNLKENSIDHYLRSAKALYKYLEKSGMIFENPFDNITMHRPKITLQVILTVDEMKRFLAAIDNNHPTGFRNRAMFEILYSTGIRKEELLNLKTFDVDTVNESIRIFGKGSKERVLPLGRHASEYIELYLKHTRPKLLSKNTPDDNNFLFVGSQGIKPAINKDFFRTVCEKAKITKNVTCHTFRRTCATHMLQNGAHPLMVAEMLGHGSLRTLGQYLKISIRELQEAHSKLKPGK